MENRVKMINEKVEKIFKDLDELNYEDKVAVITIAQKMLEVTYVPYPILLK